MFTDYLNHQSLNSLYFFPTNNDEVNKIIENFKSGILTCLNSVPTEILKFNSDTLSLPISNQCIFCCSKYPRYYILARKTPAFLKMTICPTAQIIDLYIFF